MREKYESLSLAVLKDLAKARGMKGISTLRKPALIERMLEEDAKESAKGNPAEVLKSTSEDHTSKESTRNTFNSNTQEEKKPKENTPKENTPGESTVKEGTFREKNHEGSTAEYRTRQTSEGVQERREYRTEYRADKNEQEHRTVRREYNREGSREGYSRDNGSREGCNRDGVSRENTQSESAQLDSGEKADGILEVLPDGYGFIRCENYLPGENDIYVSPSQIRRFNLKTGDIIQGNIRIKTQGEKFSALLYVSSINGFHPSEGQRRYNFEDMTPIFPNERLVMERAGGTTAMRIVDLISPIGKGQRGMIVSPPKAGKTTLLKDVAKSLLKNNKDTHLIILLIDERPEEVTDIREAIQGPNVEVIYSTFDELPEHHKRVSEMVVERARRLVEHKQDVIILLDSITRLARAYNLIIPPSGRTLSGGLDPAALHMPKRFFGAARNMREGGSLTILATALVDTGSKMDDVIYEEFKGTGNMELVLDRKLQEKRVFPAIDIQKSGTRREDLLLSKEEQEAVYIMRKALNGMKSDEAVEQILNTFARTRTNAELVQTVRKQKFL